MKKVFAISLFVLLVIASCKKDPPINQQTIPFFPGQVQFTIKDNVTLKQAMRAITGLGIKQYGLCYFDYTKTIPHDSIPYYWQIFQNCSYYECLDISSYYSAPLTSFDFEFLNLDSIKYSKWDSIVKKYQLIEMPSGMHGYGMNGFCSVPNGQEKIWIDKLNNLPVIINAGYEYEYP